MPDPPPTERSLHDSAQHVRCAPSDAKLRTTLADRASRAQLWEAIRLATISSAFRSAGVALPIPTSADAAGPSLNKLLQAAMSEFIRRTRPSLPAFVELVRCQPPGDYRPNKAMVPAVLAQQCRGYEHLDALLQIASEGVRVRLRRPLPRQTRFPRNHPSASERLPVLRANIRKEQDLFRCLVLDADIVEIWPESFASPFGVVNKGDDDTDTSGRVIHDLSYPEDGSVNAYTDPSNVPKATFEHCSSVAREILRCKLENPDHDVLVMAGDVASAYRNAYTHSAYVHMFAGFIPEDNAIIIDMSAAFGWTGSAGTYSVLGGAVAFIHGSTGSGTRRRGFYNYH
ncbi:hypothetical protein PF010_g22212 [Phytophthora fragariae]|uniref:Uncharacterized protein n=2 Tax=Phytophthora fragariae TaxID=53985 RepID=A0A6G0K9P6_9STRA|nr:hypothetical protein PF010_g22212 [Phytophthora fragariae]